MLEVWDAVADSLFSGKGYNGGVMRFSVFVGAVVFMVLAIGAPFTVVHAQSDASSATAASGFGSGTSAEAGQEYIERAKVLSVDSSTQKEIPGTTQLANYQTLTAQIITGHDAGQTVTVMNDYLMLKKGQEFYMTHDVDPNDGIDQYNVTEPYRLPTVLAWVGLFVLVTIFFGGKQGIRGLLSLVLSIGAIIYVLLPGILAGYSPILLSMGICSLIVLVGSYVTHGFTKTTTAAVVGMIVTIIITGALAFAAIHTTQLSGYNNEDTAYLNIQTSGTIDFVGLLLGGIMIGLLGILYDAAISQAVAIEELAMAAAHYSRAKVFRRAMRIGREHIGALINTLAIAYVGASLPLLLLLHFSNMSLAVDLNQEIFSTEIIRTVIGSIGLILAVPITTLIATFMLVKPKEKI
jgi:uncharacterized membrane protein